MELRKLILKFILFSLLLASVYFFAVWQVAQGQVDYFYSKFTHQASSLIIGISRSNDGISPSVIEQNFGNNEIDYPVLNFAFAHQTSDYGPVYLHAIQKKLRPETKNGLFILEVNPGSLSIPQSQPDSISTIQADQSFLSKINHFNQHPNFEYIRKMYNESLYKGFQKSRRIDKIRYSHADGWQEVLMKYEDYEVSNEEVLEWKGMKLEEAIKMKDQFKASKARMLYLEKTINYLKDFGEVYLVRVPISRELAEIEQSFWPEFNNLIDEIACKSKVGYFDYSMKGELYSTYDGSHLFGAGAKAFTQQLCNDIKSFRVSVKN
ncbi:hypothetical protein MASR2M47_21230 [Draconibacterium sp.]|jgi:hypothetical protein